MFSLTLVYLVIAPFCFAESSAVHLFPHLHRPRSFLAALDIYIQGPDKAAFEDSAAVTLLDPAGQVRRQEVTSNGHLLWNELTPSQYKIQVIAPGFAPAVQEVDAHEAGEVRVNVQLQLQNERDSPNLGVSSDPEVNYVFGEYASRFGNEKQAKSYWLKVLELRPDHLQALISMGQALLGENKVLEALDYLNRAAKLNPSHWRTHALLAEIAMRSGSTEEAIQHAEQAIELGHKEAEAVSPLLAKALAARATEVLQAYVKDHPEDDAAKTQLEALNAAPNSASAVAARPAPLPAKRGWLPVGVDEGVPPVEPGSACNLQEVLGKAGQRIQEFVRNVDRFTATESLLHETLNRLGKVSASEKRKYNYVVSIAEARPGFLEVQEYEGSSPSDSPGGMKTRGLPALVLIFHPYYSDTFSMRCEGMASVNGQRAWQIYFRQREDKANKIRSYRVGSNSDYYPVPLRGRAWIVAESFQILGLQTDLLNAIPAIGLTAEHTTVNYGPVHFGSKSLDMWLPQTAEVYSELRGKRTHRLLTFSNYLLFSVDEKQQIASPKTQP